MPIQLSGLGNILRVARSRTGILTSSWRSIKYLRATCYGVLFRAKSRKLATVTHRQAAGNLLNEQQMVSWNVAWNTSTAVAVNAGTIGRPSSDVAQGKCRSRHFEGQHFCTGCLIKRKALNR